MDYLLIEKLKSWRKKVADQDGIELFRVLSNKTIEEIADKKPKDEVGLLEVKGIKDRKFAKYGRDILSLVNENKKTESDPTSDSDAYSVSDYLDSINSQIRKIVRIKGEISSFDLRGNYLFFSLKDKNNESMLECFMWKSDYDVFGLDLSEGLEIIADGYANIRKQNGRFNFQTMAIELVGEGVLRKIYEELKKKLASEGLFELERKKLLPELVQNIGLITSEKGAVINDFLNNLGKYGFQIKFIDTRVEGALAVKELVSAVDYFRDKNIDVLVIIRGGGSLESLQAFNNEVLVRKIADFKKPVICGIGHDKDVPLACLTADKSVSTPTAVTSLLNKSWEEAVLEINNLPKDIIHKYELAISKIKYDFSDSLGLITRNFDNIEQNILNLFNKFDAIFNNLGQEIKTKKELLNDYLAQIERLNPINQLKLGFSLIVHDGKIIKSVNQIKLGDQIDIKLSDGKIRSSVDGIKKDKEN